MSDQPEADESLPNPTPDETARLMRESSHSKGSSWKRLLPPWAFSVALHLFVLPFVLGLTVVFADSLFVPPAWNDVSTASLGKDPYSLVIEDRDYSIEDVQDGQLIRAPDSTATQPPTNNISNWERTYYQPSKVPDLRTQAKSALPSQTQLIMGSLVKKAWIIGQTTRITVKTSDGKQVEFDCNETTLVMEEGDLREMAGEGGIDAFPTTTPVKVIGHLQGERNIADTVVFSAPGAFRLLQAQADGKPTINQPASSVPTGNQDSTSNGSAATNPAAGSSYGDLGVGLDPHSLGAKVTLVFFDSPASKAGVKNGDLILSVNGEKMNDFRAFFAEMGRHKPGDVVTLKIRRYETDMELKATLSKPPTPQEFNDRAGRSIDD